MSHVLHRSLLCDPPLAVRGDGLYIIDDTGSRYLDACGGAAVSILGHNNEKVIEAIRRQAETLPYAHTAFFSTAVLEELADTLVADAPGMDKVLFVSGGSEAVEAALKLSRQYFVEIGEAKRHLFIAREQSYHGNTLGALGVGGNQLRRRLFAPLLKQGNYISPCFEYRGRNADENREAYGLRVADELEAKILELGPVNVAGFIVETVAGATIGAVPAVPGYFARIREICNRYGIHLILDEVMCGTGRTGSLFAYEQEGIVPDMVTLAKGLAAGYQPIGALLTQGYLSESIKTGSGFFQHGHTFMGHATAVAAALATLRVINDDKLLENVTARGASLKNKLQTALGGHAHVGDIRGRGLLIGIELVKDRVSKEPFDPDLKLHQQVQMQAMREGLLCYGMGGTVDGRLGNHILIAPPYTIEERHEDEIVSRLVAAVAAAMPI
ncbi:MAG: aspartate aminotransferase family protein [Proteobacteria bacterium]|nr:aspartate aminotransferase family protein [Pseudomonadota bacterium]